MQPVCPVAPPSSQPRLNLDSRSRYYLAGLLRVWARQATTWQAQIAPLRESLATVLEWLEQLTATLGDLQTTLEEVAKELDP